MFVCLCFKSDLIRVWQEINFYQLRISFQRKLSLTPARSDDAAVLMLSKQCPHLYNGAMIYWRHPFHPIWRWENWKSITSVTIPGWQLAARDGWYLTRGSFQWTIESCDPLVIAPIIYYHPHWGWGIVDHGEAREEAVPVCHLLCHLACESVPSVDSI